MAGAEALVLLAHAAATSFMTGLIWFVQVVHYPLFAGVGEDGYRRYQSSHMRRTTAVVGPVMLAEAAGAVLVLALDLGQMARYLAIAGACLLGVVWASTFLVQVPLHERLGRGFDRRTAAALVATNWIRTIAWTLRSIIAVALVLLGAGI